MNKKAEILDGLSAATPALRRYARALCAGASAALADELVQESLQTVGERIRRKEFRPADHAEARIETYLTLSALSRARLDRADGAGPRLPPIVVGLASLSFDDRAALLLVSLEGFGYDCAARIVGVSREMLLDRLMRARAEFNAETPNMATADGRQRRPMYLRVVK